MIAHPLLTKLRRHPEEAARSPSFLRPLIQYRSLPDGSLIRVGTKIKESGFVWQLTRRRQMANYAGFDRHRDKNGAISKKHGNTLIRTLRKTYGVTFARGCQDDEKLSDVLHKLDEPSLSSLIQDHAAGKLEQICRDNTA
jgi:hypothetical protein